mmetsp:Transcript_53054/g.121841  ORF Transcript_53054/g.121841 Transcript_53054/m.121841 type:complete len:306 (-) Transcript_53054:389-1306(-)|eukprot:CAMPEP_0119353874 /NCGR_PEP_ID=MMETSP1334-20130426/2969_1 /TAXON_ID=127549 /ORGANISM="Calcidiscus leptoporus, Strain RCC1130" /LENGTH=305 /DNA_ID=CAMNT_0007367269 /DNA_START=85 /DNA_END=1002 /DNA_ORIENTATION=+
MTFNMKRKSGFASKPTAPAEAVKLKVFTTQKVALAMPYMTPRAPDIRTEINFKVLTPEGKRIFWFNPDADEEGLKWTNVALNSTADNPVLAAPPAMAVEVAHRVLSRCKAVSKVTIVDENEQPLTVEQVKTMQFRPLEESAETEDEDADDDDEDDAIADAVVELKDQVAAHEDKINQLADGMNANDLKLCRAETEIQDLKNIVTELKQAMQNGVLSTVHEANDEIAVTSSVSPPATPAPKKNRLQKATDKKRKLHDELADLQDGASSSTPIDVIAEQATNAPSDTEEEPIALARAKRVLSKKRRL